MSFVSRWFIYGFFLCFMCFAPVMFLVPCSHGSETPTTATKASTWHISGNKVNLRAGAGMGYAVLNQLNRGANVRVLSSVKAQGEKWNWHKIQLADGQTGWLSGQYLTPAVPPAQLAQAPKSTVEALFTPGITPHAVIDLAEGAPFQMLGQVTSAADLDFTIIRKGTGDNGVLVFGGIQGDEPGGFSAASLLVTHYDITKGTLIIAPNLNFPSIVDRSRGNSGDMNRKFADLTPRDPQFEQVRKVQQLILMPQISLILNLHDGSGFYTPTHKSALRNPKRWGQSVIIDTAMSVDGTSMTSMANTAAASANTDLLRPEHHIGVRNTRTDEGNEEMSKTLTWFAMRNGKTAFGLEASKELGVAERTFYHLRMVESFLQQAGIGFTRRFTLNPAGIATALSENARFAFVNGRTTLPLHNIRPRLAGVLPLSKPATHTSASPLLAITNPVNDAGSIQIHYGNNLLTQCAVRWFEPDTSLDQLPVTVDGTARTVRFGDVVSVTRDFCVERLPGYRINAIGATANANDESGITLARKDFQPAYSIDRAARMFRVETYKDQRLVGMFIVSFGAPLASSEAEFLSLTDAPAVTKPAHSTSAKSGNSGKARKTAGR